MGAHFDVILVQISHFLVDIGPLDALGGGVWGAQVVLLQGDLSLAAPHLEVGSIPYTSG